MIDHDDFTDWVDRRFSDLAEEFAYEEEDKFNDFFTQKNYNNHLKLMNDKNYECIMEDIKYMNGVSAFKKLK